MLLQNASAKRVDLDLEQRRAEACELKPEVYAANSTETGSNGQHQFRPYLTDKCDLLFGIANHGRLISQMSLETSRRAIS